MEVGYTRIRTGKTHKVSIHAILQKVTILIMLVLVQEKRMSLEEEDGFANVKKTLTAVENMYYPMQSRQ